MNQQEILRVIDGLKKKHGTSFSLKLKYMTNSGKTRKRSGLFIDLIDNNILILRNELKGGEGKYLLKNICEVAKSA